MDKFYTKGSFYITIVAVVFIILYFTKKTKIVNNSDDVKKYTNTIDSLKTEKDSIMKVWQESNNTFKTKIDGLMVKINNKDKQVKNLQDEIDKLQGKYDGNQILVDSTINSIF